MVGVTASEVVSTWSGTSSPREVECQSASPEKAASPEEAGTFADELGTFARDPCYTDPAMNLTLTIDDETLKRARMRALDQGTSVNALVRDFLRSYAGSEDENLALRRFVEVGEGSGAGARSEGRVWTRDGLYEERLRWPRS